MTVEEPAGRRRRRSCALTEKAGGRVDDRTEQAPRPTRRSARAALTIRLPATAVSADARSRCATLGTVDRSTCARRTSPAPRRTSTPASTRMRALGRPHGGPAGHGDHERRHRRRGERPDRAARPTSSSCRSQRARLAEQVSLSTLNIALVGPDLPPYVEPPAPPVEPTGPQSFLDGLAAGWSALVVGGRRASSIVLGVLLPVARRRRARSPGASSSWSGGTGAPHPRPEPPGTADARRSRMAPARPGRRRRAPAGAVGAAGRTTRGARVLR